MRAHHRVRADPVNNPVPFVAFCYPQDERLFHCFKPGLGGRVSRYFT